VSLLEASYILFILPPWYRNISKRLIKSPKLYFYDVGLASYLLGLENELHISRHPLRGNLFENLVIMEALKYRYNRGRKSNLHFYRDGKGSEVDLILEIGADVFPIEIKAGETITADYFKGLKHFMKIIPDLRWGTGVIYGGRERQVRSDTRIYPVYDMEEMLSEVGG
jgi:predicted AAA+ superfamily ATPase